MKTIGIVGSRRRDTKLDYLNTAEQFWKVYQDGDRIVSGGCYKGGDRFAEVISKNNNIPITIHLAEWDKFGKKAGFLRNTFIAEDADVLIAVVASDRTGGTEDTIKKFQKLGKTAKLILV